VLLVVFAALRMLYYVLLYALLCIVDIRTTDIVMYDVGVVGVDVSCCVTVAVDICVC